MYFIAEMACTNALVPERREMNTFRCSFTIQGLKLQLVVNFRHAWIITFTRDYETQLCNDVQTSMSSITSSFVCWSLMFSPLPVTVLCYTRSEFGHHYAGKARTWTWDIDTSYLEKIYWLQCWSMVFLCQLFWIYVRWYEFVYSAGARFTKRD